MVRGPFVFCHFSFVGFQVGFHVTFISSLSEDSSLLFCFCCALGSTLKANLKACALNGRPRYWTVIFRQEAGLFEDGTPIWKRPPFDDQWRIMGEALFLL